MRSSSFAQRLAVTGALPRLGARSGTPLRIGFLSPFTGDERVWGAPGLNGCRLWADWLNARGGLLVASERHPVEIVARDSAQGPAAAIEAAQELMLRHRVRLILTLGGDSVAPAIPWLMSQKALVATLLPSDLSPDTPYMIAPAEVHPLFNVTGVDWIRVHRPDIRRVALCSQTDSLGLPSLAVYRAAFEAAGLDRVKEVRYPAAERDADAIVAAMLAEAPDLLCWCSSAPPMVEALTEAAFRQGFAGEILSCTADDYPRMIARTSAEFMGRYTFQFPDFDDPGLADKAFFFNQPAAFFAGYAARFPGEWSAVSWEYAAILDLWHNAVEMADTTDPVTVLAAMKRSQRMTHAFGPAQWWGTELFGIDNALVGDWPVVRIRAGRARIVAFGSTLAWLERHGALLEGHMRALGQMWDQRLATRRGRPLPDRRAFSPPGGAASAPRSERAS